MKYIKPEIEIEKFSIIEEITDNGISSPSFNPPNETSDDPIWEELGSAFGEILTI